MGALPYPGGTTFRVWAPHADAVFVTGTFDDWAGTTSELAPDGDGSSGTWSADVPGVDPGAEYRFTIRTGEGDVSKLDPYVRQLTNSVGNGIVYDPDSFDWGDDAFDMPSWDDLVIYEMHIGTFATTADLRGDVRRRPAPTPLSPATSACRAVQVMPPFEFAGDISWGYNPAHLFAIESGYGGPDAFKRFIRDAHAHGIAVIVDVVYNHLGPSDLDLWRFDGWSEGDGGGIYFYNDDRAVTPWGATRPDYGRGEVRTFLRDSALCWLEEFRCDGLRFDSTINVRTVDRRPERPGGRAAGRRVVPGLAERRHPGATALEDHDRGGPPGRSHASWSRPVPAASASGRSGTAGSSAASGPRWSPQTTPTGTSTSVVEAIVGEGRGASLSRVIYTESHDDVANGDTRVPEAIAPGDAGGWWAKKRAVLGSALVLTSPGIPMLFQGQELLEDRWFDDSVALDWDKAESNKGILRLHRDLIGLRRARDGATLGLRGSNVAILRADQGTRLLAMHRWMDGGPHDDTVVVANFADRTLTDVALGFPAPGRWNVRFNSDASTYAHDFGSHDAFDLEADGGPADGCDQSGLVSVGPYSVVIYSRED